MHGTQGAAILPLKVMAIRHVLPVCCVYKISFNLHQPIRLRKMHNTELLIEAMSRPEV